MTVKEFAEAAIAVFLERGGEVTPDITLDLMKFIEHDDALLADYNTLLKENDFANHIIAKTVKQYFGLENDKVITLDGQCSLLKNYTRFLPIGDGADVNNNNNMQTEYRMPDPIVKTAKKLLDNSGLFERYVYCLFAERYGSRIIGYQEGCGDSIMDFTKKDERMILDTKYIPSWNDHTDHENARQLSGYARRTALRSKYLNPPTGDFLCPCVVIYPSDEGLTSLRDLPDHWLTDDGTPTFPALQQVKEYQKFYKLPIKLPLKQS